MSSSAIKTRLTNKYEATIILCYIMAILFFVIIVIFSIHIQPLVYKVLRCNAGSLLFCELDTLVSARDSSTDLPNIIYSTLLSVKIPQNPTDQILKFPYYDAMGADLSYFYIKLTFVDSLASGNVTANSNNIFNIDLDATGATEATAVTIQSVKSNDAAQVTDAFIYTIGNKIGGRANSSDYVFVGSYQNNGTQFLYALYNEGNGTPAITSTKVDGGTDISSSNSIFGFTTLNLNKDDFQTHESTVENVNDGFLEIKLQTTAIVKNPSAEIAGCSDPGAKTFAKNSNHTFVPSHGLYYDKTKPIPDTITPCIYNKIYGKNDNCGYRYVDKTSPSNNSNTQGGDYQINHMYYNSKATSDYSGGSAYDPGTYYNGFKTDGSRRPLSEDYGSGVEILETVQLQITSVCGGFPKDASQSSPLSRPWTRNNYNNGTAVVNTGPDNENDNSAFQFSTHPRLVGNTGTTTEPSLPIILGFK